MLADVRTQHPLGYGKLYAIRKSHNQNYGADPPQVTDHLDFYAIARMMAIADFRCAQIMSSTRTP
jgi:hypothetical protein